MDLDYIAGYCGDYSVPIVPGRPSDALPQQIQQFGLFTDKIGLILPETRSIYLALQRCLGLTPVDLEQSPWEVYFLDPVDLENNAQKVQFIIQTDPQTGYMTDSVVSILSNISSKAEVDL